MSKLLEPRYCDLPNSNLGGAPVLMSLWERFDVSLLLTQVGIHKLRGVPTWQIAFAFVTGIIAECASDLQRVKFLSQDAVMKMLLFSRSISQSAMSRFLTGYSQWREFSRKRVGRFQQDIDTALMAGDVIALDDTLIPHRFAKKIPFLTWLFDHSQKVHVWGLNLVALHAIKQNGVEYPLFHAFWRKLSRDCSEKSVTKFILALEMLMDLRSLLPSKLRLWLSIDRWFFNKKFLSDVQSLGFDWVTKAKRNTVFYRRLPGPVPGSADRYVKVNAREVLRQNYHFLIAAQTTGLVSLSLPDLHLMYYEPVENAKSRKKRKRIYKPVCVVAVMKLTEDETEDSRRISQSSSDKESAATYKGAYLLISNRIDVPAEVVTAYEKRWRIELLFRNAKQEFGLTQCHSTNENHVHAHVALLFVAETLVRFAQWEHNKQAGTKDQLTHGQVIRLIFRIRCALTVPSTDQSKSDVVQPNFPISAQRFASFFQKYWPSQTFMGWFDPSQNWHLITSSA